MKKFILLIAIIVLFASCTTIKSVAPVPDKQWSTDAGSTPPQIGSFSMDIPVTLEFSSIKNEVMKQYSSQSFSGINLKILDVSVYGLNSSEIVIGLNIDAQKPKTFLKVKGWIYLKGTPNLDVENQILTIDNVEIDIKTKQAILNVAGWLVQPIVSHQIEKFKFNLGELVASKKNMFAHYTMDGYGALNLNINNFSLYDLYITPDELIARIKIEGTIGVTVDVK